jgi:KipI family sensor histidine kinase inhibitor
MRSLPYGPLAVLLDDLPVPPATLARAIRHARPDGVIDVVPAARTVLVTFADLTALGDAVESLDVLAETAGEDDRSRDLIEIQVQYIGSDLEGIAERTALSIGDVIEIHTDATYQVAFCGFAPGFAYLTGLDRRLWVPRRETPRTRVPKGSVAIAAEYTAVYPGVSPGGWHLLGTTEAVMFDPQRSRPSLLQPGDRVRFQAL